MQKRERGPDEREKQSYLSHHPLSSSPPFLPLPVLCYLSPVSIHHPTPSPTSCSSYEYKTFLTSHPATDLEEQKPPQQKEVLKGADPCLSFLSSLLSHPTPPQAPLSLLPSEYSKAFIPLQANSEGQLLGAFWNWVLPPLMGPGDLKLPDISRILFISYRQFLQNQLQLSI